MTSQHFPWTTPAMTIAQLDREIAAGTAFLAACADLMQAARVRGLVYQLQADRAAVAATPAAVIERAQAATTTATETATA